jgi:hypothetical protein
LVFHKWFHNQSKALGLVWGFRSTKVASRGKLACLESETLHNYLASLYELQNLGSIVSLA